MEINLDDIIVIPEEIEVPANFPYKYHKIKYLNDFSIVFSSRRGPMNIQTMIPSPKMSSKFILNLLGLGKEKAEKKDIFFRHVRVLNEKTNEFYHNKGATVLVDLKASEGRFLFSYAICNHLDNFNKLIAHNVCKERMDKGEVIECINYDPNLSILQNIYIAIGVQQGQYPLTDFDWRDILPELYGTYTNEQKESLSSLRRLIRDKANTY